MLSFLSSISFISGLGKGSASLGTIYGGIGANSPNKSKKIQQLEPFPDAVTRSQFFYLVSSGFQSRDKASFGLHKYLGGKICSKCCLLCLKLKETFVLVFLDAAF